MTAHLKPAVATIDNSEYGESQCGIDPEEDKVESWPT